MELFVVTPDLFVEAWDSEDARTRARQLFDWMQECPLVDVAFVMPEGCVQKLEDGVPSDSFVAEDDYWPGDGTL